MKKRGPSKDSRDEDGDDDAPKMPAAPKVPFNNPFAAALKSHPSAATGPAPSSSGQPPKAADTKRVPAPARAVVRMERKGHGGKEVTVVEQLGLSAKDLERWLKSLKQSLGCGGSIDGGNIVLQGDHRDRLKKVLEDRGVKKVSIG